MDGTGVEELGKESALRMSDAETAILSCSGGQRQLPNCLAYISRKPLCPANDV